MKHSTPDQNIDVETAVLPRICQHNYIIPHKFGTLRAYLSTFKKQTRPDMFFSLNVAANKIR